MNPALLAAPWVLDASVTAQWLLPDEGSAAADRFFFAAAHDDACVHVPALWRWETGNLLLVARRRGRLVEASLRAAWATLAALKVLVHDAPTHDGIQAAWRLADAHGLTVYDASYLELAQRLDAPLATRDGKLEAAAAREGVMCLKV